MQTNRSFIVSALVLSAGLFLTASARAGDGCSSCTPPVATATAAATAAPFDLVQAKASYPLDVCVVSGEKLEGDMGGPVDYIHKEEGKPDRLVRFCCKSCIKDFKKDPAQFLKKIDGAIAVRPSQSDHQH